MSIISEYKKKTRKSAKLFAQSSKLHVNGVSHNIRFYEPYPFVVKKSSGKNLIDVDGNKYTDGHCLKHGRSFLFSFSGLDNSERYPPCLAG